MNEITRVGVDLAKRAIQVHAVDASGRVVFTKALAPDKFAAWYRSNPARGRQDLTLRRSESSLASSTVPR